MYYKDVEKSYPLVWKALQTIVYVDGMGPMNDHWEFPSTYDNMPIKDFLENFNLWLGNLDGKKTMEVISPQDFLGYLGWDENRWESFNSYKEWELVYGPGDALENFSSSEEAVMDVISVKFSGQVYSDFLADFFNGEL